MSQGHSCLDACLSSYSGVQVSETKMYKEKPFHERSKGLKHLDEGCSDAVPCLLPDALEAR